CFFFQAEDGIRGRNVTGVQTCALPIWKVRQQLPTQMDFHVLIHILLLGTSPPFHLKLFVFVYCLTFMCPHPLTNYNKSMYDLFALVIDLAVFLLVGREMLDSLHVLPQQNVCPVFSNFLKSDRYM